MKSALLMGAMATALAAAALAAPAQAAEPGWYAALDVGYHVPDDIKLKSKTGPTLIINAKSDYALFDRVGYKFSSGWRVEGELGIRESDFKNTLIKGSADPATLMGNVIYDFMPDAKWTPFLGGGIGIAYVDPTIKFLPAAYTSGHGRNQVCGAGDRRRFLCGL